MSERLVREERRYYMILWWSGEKIRLEGTKHNILSLLKVSQLCLHPYCCSCLGYYYTRLMWVLRASQASSSSLLGKRIPGGKQLKEYWWPWWGHSRRWGWWCIKYIMLAQRQVYLNAIITVDSKVWISNSKYQLYF